MVGNLFFYVLIVFVGYFKVNCIVMFVLGYVLFIFICVFYWLFFGFFLYVYVVEGIWLFYFSDVFWVYVYKDWIDFMDVDVFI